LKYDLKVNDIKDNGYITRDRSYIYSFKIVPGRSYLYNGDFSNTGKYEDESILVALPNISGDLISVTDENLISTEVNIYDADESGNSGLHILKTTTDYNVSPPASKDETSEEDQYLPFATFKESDGKNLSIRSFEFTISAPILLESHPEFENELSNSLIETQEEAEILAVSKLREDSSLSLSFKVPFNIPIDCGKVVRFYIRRSGINEKVFVRNVSGSWQGFGTPIVTTISGRIYVL
jgi:hypothetical protein